MDLSDIREKNKEQDEEIQDLEGEKADKRALNELSGTVESLISTQSEINQEFANSISGMSNDIEELKAIDSEFAEQLSAITSGVDEAMEAVEELDGRLDKAEEDIIELSGAIDTIKEEYAKKDDVYTKEEIDEMVSSGFSGYATQEWVESQGYLTEASGDSRYTKIEDFEAFVDTYSSGFTDLTDAISEADERIDELSAKTDANTEAIEELDEKVGLLSGEVVTITNSIEDEISSIEERVSANTENISILQSAVSSNTSSIEDLYNTKADKASLEEVREQLQGEIDSLDENKADKSELMYVSGAVDDLSDRLDLEIERSTSVDNAMSGSIDTLGEVVYGFDDRITAVETGLTKEIADRIQGDLDLIGTEEDERDADTIWGAKNMAKGLKREAVTEANDYTDGKVSMLIDDIDELEDWARQNFSSAATKEYVDRRCYETKQEVTSTFNTALENEIERAELAESNLDVKIQVLSAQTHTNSDAIAHNATRINAITRWEGSDPDEYEEWASGHTDANGVLDVLHREFHEFEETHGTIKEIRVEDGNLIIVYHTQDGDKETVVPISGIIDLEDYYTKEETEALIEEAISHIDLEDYYTKEETDEKISEAVSGIGEDIEDIEERVSANTTSIETLFEKLGYDDNDTLVTTNPHEVAFGEYNVSNTGEDDKDKTVFSIGNGTSDENRSNAIEIRKDGTVYMWIENEFISINNLLGMLAHEIY